MKPFALWSHAGDTIEFSKYFTIKPSTDFSKGLSKNYFLSKEKEMGKKVDDEFVYNSDNNPTLSQYFRN